MRNLFWLTMAQMVRLSLPRSHGRPRVDDRRVPSGIAHVNRDGLRWRDAPAAYGSHKTWHRLSRKGVFARMLLALADAGQDASILMPDATYLKVHRTVASLRADRGLEAGRRLIGRTKAASPPSSMS